MVYYTIVEPTLAKWQNGALLAVICCWMNFSSFAGDMSRAEKSIKDEIKCKSCREDNSNGAGILLTSNSMFFPITGSTL